MSLGMHIEAKEWIAGVPIIQVRNFLSRHQTILEQTKAQILFEETL